MDFGFECMEKFFRKFISLTKKKILTLLSFNNFILIKILYLINIIVILI